MGDTWQLPNRIQAGSASDRGGIISGDKFPPVAKPWERTGGLNDLRFPPYTIWEGELREGQDMVMLTPTIWEWDPGAGFWDRWLAWQVQVDKDYGMRAKDIFGKIWPVSRPVFDAVSLGIQTVGTLAGTWSPLGQSRRRPIGIQRDPPNPDGILFNPRIIALNSETADFLSRANPQGLSAGILELPYTDDPYLRGVYSIFVQVEKLSGGPAPQWANVGHANNVISMTAMDGRLFAATGDNRLWVRDAVDHEIDWTPIGHTNEVVGLAATGGRLFCATGDNRLWSREATPVELDWTPIGHANNIRTMAASGNSLYSTTADDTLWRRDPVLSDVNWQQVGTAPQARTLAATNQGLFATTSGNRLLMRQLPLRRANHRHADVAGGCGSPQSPATRHYRSGVSLGRRRSFHPGHGGRTTSHSRAARRRPFRPVVRSDPRSSQGSRGRRR